MGEILREIVDQLKVDEACERTKEGSRAIELRNALAQGNFL